MRGDDDEAADGGFCRTQSDEQGAVQMPRQVRPSGVKAKHGEQRREDGQYPFAVALDDQGPVHGCLPVQDKLAA